MAFRSQFVDSVVTSEDGNSMTPIQGVAATPYICNPDGTDGQQAPVYIDAASSNSGNMITGASGQVAFYLDPGNYNIHFDDQQSPPRIKSFVRGFTSISVLSAAEISSLNSSLSDQTARKWGTYGLSNPQQEAMSVGGGVYNNLPTPDAIEITAHGLSTLIGVFYHAIWQESVAGAARAAIFVESNQLKVPSAGGPVTQAAATGGVVNIDKPLSSFEAGLMSAGSVGSSYVNDVTTGQAQAIANVNATLSYDLAGTVYSTSVTPSSGGGPCWMFLPSIFDGAALNVSVRFTASGGNAYVRNRVLRVVEIPFQL